MDQNYHRYFFCIQVTLSATINIGNGKYSTILNESDNLSAGSTNVVARNAYIPYVNAKEISVIVLIHTSKPTYAGSNLTFVYMVPIYMNTALNTSYSSSCVAITIPFDLLLT